MKRPSFGSNPSSGNNNINNHNNNNNNNIPPVSGNVLFNSYQKGNPNMTTTTTSTALGDGQQQHQQQQQYQPPTVFYAQDQTSILHDTTRTYYETDDTANKVLHTLVSQRQQLQNTDTTIHHMHSTTQQVSKEIDVLKQKYIQKKRQLYIYIVGLTLLDVLLFVRMIQCHGNFYCW